MRDLQPGGKRDGPADAVHGGGPSRDRSTDLGHEQLQIDRRRRALGRRGDGDLADDREVQVAAAHVSCRRQHRVEAGIDAADIGGSVESGCHRVQRRDRGGQRIDRARPQPHECAVHRNVGTPCGTQLGDGGEVEAARLQLQQHRIRQVRNDLARGDGADRRSGLTDEVRCLERERVPTRRYLDREPVCADAGEHVAGWRRRTVEPGDHDGQHVIDAEADRRRRRNARR